jgi:hypothetical protein
MPEPITFTADKPFIFIISGDVAGTILFRVIFQTQTRNKTIVKIEKCDKL